MDRVALIALLFSLCLYAEVNAVGKTFEVDELAGSTIAKIVGKRFQQALQNVLPEINQTGAHSVRNGVRLQRAEESRFGYMHLDGQTQQYLPAGYAYISYSNVPTDKTCQKSSIEVGVPANTCLSGGNYGFKIQLTEDSCDDAVIEYFSDHNCTKPVQQTRMDLGDFSGCNSFTGDSTMDLGDGNTVAVPLYFWKVHCTAQPTKPVNAPSVTLDLYNGDDACTGFAGYVNFASDMCFPVNDGTMSLGLRCATGSSASLTQFWGSKCGVAYAPNPFPPTCALVSDGLPEPPARSGDSTAAVPKAVRGRLRKTNKGTGSGQPSAGDDDKEDDGEGDGAASRDDDTGDSEGSDDVNLDLDLDLVDRAGLRSYQLTCAPRNTNYGAIVSVSQVLATSADALASYKQQRAAHILAFQRTVADSVGSGLSSSNVYLSTVCAAAFTAKPTLVPTAAPSKLSVPNLPGIQAQTVLNGTTVVGTDGAENALNVVYTVVSYSARLDNAGLAGSLKRAVSDGVFDDLLNLYAQTEGARGLIGAKSKEVQVRTPDDNRVSPSGDSDQSPLQRYMGKVSNEGAVVVGGVSLGLGLLLVLLRWWLRRRKVGVLEDKSKAFAVATALKEDADDEDNESYSKDVVEGDIEVAWCGAVSASAGDGQGEEA